MKARLNPFASAHVESLPYAPTGGGYDMIMKKLQDSGGLGAIVGPEGSGKTTLLAELRDRLAEKGFLVHLEGLSLEKRKPDARALKRFISARAPEKAFLLDGAEQTSPLTWRLLKWKAGKADIFLVTSHFPGLLPTLVETSTSPELLCKLANTLLPPENQMTFEEARSLHEIHKGNMRLAFRALYDDWAAK